MCLLAFAWRPGQPQPLLVLANRDEFYARPSQALSEWPDNPGLFAGRDLQAGGTWLGVDRRGRFAALTNIRDPRQPPGQHSRGALPRDFLQGELSITDYLARLQAQLPRYAGFNLLLGDGQQLCHLNARSGQARVLAPGLYALSNADLDSPWPKLLRLRQGLAEHLDADDERLLELLADRQPATDAELPDTGIGQASERLLSSIFIHSAHYGTRASTLLRQFADGRQQLRERRFGPLGQALGETRLHLPG